MRKGQEREGEKEVRGRVKEIVRGSEGGRGEGEGGERRVRGIVTGREKGSVVKGVK